MAAATWLSLLIVGLTCCVNKSGSNNIQSDIEISRDKTKRNVSDDELQRCGVVPLVMQRECLDTRNGHCLLTCGDPNSGQRNTWQCLCLNKSSRILQRSKRRAHQTNKDREMKRCGPRILYIYTECYTNESMKCQMNCVKAGKRTFEWQCVCAEILGD